MTTLTFTIPADLVAVFAIQGEPVSKARARFTGYGSKVRAYTPANVVDAERAVAEAFKAAGGLFEPDNQTAFGVDITFHAGTRQRRDVDNMTKLILDGLNGVAWVDDTQVLDVVARKRFTDRASARTEVAIYRTGKLDRLTAPCEWCKSEFPTWESHRGRVRFCSAACRTSSRDAARNRTCEECGSSFSVDRKSHIRRFCSPECRSEARKTTIPCAVCGSAFRQYESRVDQRPYCSDACVKENNARKAREKRGRP